MKKCSCF